MPKATTKDGAGTLWRDSASALAYALSQAREHGSATAALRATGAALDGGDHGQEAHDLARHLAGIEERDWTAEALALGVLAGRASPRPA